MKNCNNVTLHHLIGQNYETTQGKMVDIDYNLIAVKRMYVYMYICIYTVSIMTVYK